MAIDDDEPHSIIQRAAAGHKPSVQPPIFKKHGDAAAVADTTRLLAGRGCNLRGKES
jgi:hypothetical protein